MQHSTRQNEATVEAFLGIDLGGTYTRVAWMGPSEDVLSVAPTPDGKSGAAFLRGIVKGLLERGLNWRAAGISCAPGVDENGVVTGWPNRPDWVGVPLVDSIRVGHCQTIFTNDDGVCGALWEHQAGVGGGVSATLGLGTGLAVGVVGNGEAVDTGQGGDSIAHRPVPGAGWLCRCGRSGCFQVALNADALIRAFQTKASEQAQAGARELLAHLIAQYGVQRVTLTGGCCRLLPAEFLLAIFQHPGVEVSTSATPSSSSMGGALLSATGGSAARNRIRRCLQALEVSSQRRYEP